MEDFETTEGPLIVQKVKFFAKDLFLQIYNNDTSKLRYTYFTLFSKLTDAYYKEDEWPLFKDIEDCINETALFDENDETFDIDKYDKVKELFSCLYTELCNRHIYVHGKPLLHHRCESYDNYMRLFDFLKEHSNSESFKIPVLPYEWTADLMDEFLYQFEDFCSFRHQLADLTEEELQDLEEYESQAQSDEESRVFDIVEVLKLLQTLCPYCDFKHDGKKKKTLWNLGYVSYLGISRVHVLLADYRLALKSLSMIDLEDKRAYFTKLSSVHLTLFYYTGLCYLMIKRYTDAMNLFSTLLLSLKALDRSRMRAVCYADAQFYRKYEKIKTLCAICLVMNRFNARDDTLKKILFDSQPRSPTHEGNMLQKLSSLTTSEADVEDKVKTLVDAFKKSSPRFITPEKPSYSQIESKDKNTADIQAKWFGKEAKSQLSVPDLSSLLQLYSSISIKKLAKLSETDEESLVRSLLYMKNLSEQKVRVQKATEFKSTKDIQQFDHLAGVKQSISSLYFYIEDETVHISERPKKQKFADFFLQNSIRLSQCAEDITNFGKKQRGKR